MSLNVGLDLLLRFWLNVCFVKQEDEVDMDEVECILANLIHQRYVKGYIAHDKQLLVCSRDQAFPPIQK